jgi:hypothetical protein
MLSRFDATARVGVATKLVLLKKQLAGLGDEPTIV